MTTRATGFAERPSARPRAAADERIVRRLLATIRNGKAVLIPFDGDESQRVRMRYSSAIARKGYIFRGRTEGAYLRAWVETGRP